MIGKTLTRTNLPVDATTFKYDGDFIWVEDISGSTAGAGRRRPSPYSATIYASHTVAYANHKGHDATEPTV